MMYENFFQWKFNVTTKRRFDTRNGAMRIHVLDSRIGSQNRLEASRVHSALTMKKRVKDLGIVEAATSVFDLVCFIGSEKGADENRVRGRRWNFIIEDINEVVSVIRNENFVGIGDRNEFVAAP